MPEGAYEDEMVQLAANSAGQTGDHENDTDDIPEGEDPVMLALDSGEGWKGYFKGQDSDLQE